jgi:uncharacterized iron-regulated membrane protein
MVKMSVPDTRHGMIVSRPALPTASASRRTRTGRRPRRRPRRSAAVVLETILALPIFVIMLMGLVEFGVLVENLQYVQAASRAGAMVASRTAAATFHPPPVPPTLPADVLVAVNDELGRMQTGVVARQVRLETNVDNAGAVGATISRVGGKDAITDPYVAVTAPAAPAGAYVRVTVFVDVPDVTPNVLATFGLDFKNEVVQQTTTFPWAGP